jgi:hypothetical protein
LLLPVCKYLRLVGTILVSAIVSIPVTHIVYFFSVQQYYLWLITLFSLFIFAMQ